MRHRLIPVQQPGDVAGKLYAGQETQGEEALQRPRCGWLELGVVCVDGFGLLQVYPKDFGLIRLRDKPPGWPWTVVSGSFAATSLLANGVGGHGWTQDESRFTPQSWKSYSTVRGAWSLNLMSLKIAAVRAA